MPYKRTYKKKSYRPFKKYGKKYGKKRFTKKKLAKNNSNILTQRAVLACRMLNVKLPWVKTFTTTVAAASGQSYLFGGNSLIPYTTAGNTAGSQNTPATGDSIPAGAFEYSQFYDKYMVYGSSIKIEAHNPSTLLRS